VKRNRVQFRVPASTANLGAGFDALSLALDRYLTVTVEKAPALRIEASGTNADRISCGEDNLIYEVARYTAERYLRTLPPFALTIVNEIPLARGMGSSAAAIIAGVTVYELLFDDALNEEEFFRCALHFENHPDNLSTALYGGLTAAGVNDHGRAMVSRLHVAEGIKGVVVIPSFELSTGEARRVLPDTYSREDAVYNLQRSALTIAALTSGDFRLLREGMRDRIHQPYRAKLIPGLEEILGAELPGLYGIALSGAGPTVFALADPKHIVAVGQDIAGIFERHGVSAAPHLVGMDYDGRVILE
jgi:homoserine kinase